MPQITKKTPKKSTEKSILALQLPSEPANLEANIEKVTSVMQKYKEKDLDFLFLPEVWGIGWLPEIFKDHTENFGGRTVEFLRGLALEYNVNVVGGSFIRAADGSLHNTCPIINRQGQLLGHYDKNHLFAPDGEAKVVCAGEKLTSLTIEGLKIAFSICYDIRFPELFRAYLGKNAQDAPHLLINLAAWPKSRKEHYSVLSKARAIENQAYFLGLSQCGEIKADSGAFNAGCSILVDPFGDTIEQLGEEEGEIFAQIDIEQVKDIREKYPNLGARREYSI